MISLQDRSTVYGNSIDADVFQDCTALKRADITANITSYGARGTGSIFSDCTNMTYLRVGPGVKTVTSQILPPINAVPNEVLIDGDGTGASAFAEFDSTNGTITGVVVTSPGNDYTTATATINKDGTATIKKPAVSWPVTIE